MGAAGKPPTLLLLTAAKPLYRSARQLTGLPLDAWVLGEPTGAPAYLRVFGQIGGAPAQLRNEALFLSFVPLPLEQGSFSSLSRLPV